MSRVFSVRKAVVAATLTIVATPFAIGGELPAWLAPSNVTSGASALFSSASPQPNESAAAPVVIVDRSAKSDRVTPPRAGSASQTVSIEPRGLDSTSVLIRIVTDKPEQPAAEKPATLMMPRGSAAKPRVACEPVVSVLTEVAKQLAPGRCVT
ncbi:MAG: hypothetical protein WBA29_07220 [Xanthobacteraceae bacterium]